jgi:hypothetical protein
MTELADRFDAGPDELAAALGKKRWHTESRQLPWPGDLDPN